MSSSIQGLQSLVFVSELLPGMAIGLLIVVFILFVCFVIHSTCRCGTGRIWHVFYFIPGFFVWLFQKMRNSGSKSYSEPGWS